jgi:hypothetical protein
MQREEKGYQILMVNSEDRSAPVSKFFKNFYPWIEVFKIIWGFVHG